MAVPYTELTGAKEGCVFQITGTFKDEAEVAIPAADLNSVEMWLKNKDDNAVINSRSATNILNAGPGTVDSGGNFEINLTADDNPIVDAAAHPSYETHILTIKFTWNGGAKVNFEEIHLIVANLTHVPTS